MCLAGELWPPSRASYVDDVKLDQPPVGAAAHPSRPHHDDLERDGMNR